MKTVQDWINGYAETGIKPRGWFQFQEQGYTLSQVQDNLDLWTEQCAAVRIGAYIAQNRPVTLSKTPAAVRVRHERKQQPVVKQSVTVESRYCEICHKALNGRSHSKTCGAACRKALSRRLRA